MIIIIIIILIQLDLLASRSELESTTLLRIAPHETVKQNNILEYTENQMTFVCIQLKMNLFDLIWIDAFSL